MWYQMLVATFSGKIELHMILIFLPLFFYISQPFYKLYVFTGGKSSEIQSPTILLTPHILTRLTP
jgi:hypothetical protein